MMTTTMTTNLSMNASPKPTADEPVEPPCESTGRRNRAEWTMLRGLLGIVSHARSARLDALLGDAAWYSLRSRRTVAIENVANSLASRGMTRREARRIAHASFRHFGRTLGEALRLSDVAPVVRWRRPDALTPVLSADSSALILSGHLGNWELAAWAIQQRAILHGKHLNLIVAPIRNPYASQYAVSMRRTWGVIPHDRDRSLAWALRTLERRELIGTAADQYPGIDAVRGGSVFTVPFLGRSTPFSATLFRLAERKETAIIGISAIRADDGGSDIFTERVPKGDAEEMCRHWVRWLESQILEYPTQYLWMHRRWKEYDT